MFQKIKLPIIIIALLFVGFFLYNKFMKKSESDSVVVTPASNIASPDKNILPLLLKINTITFDASIFTDKVFTSLHDYGKAIVPEEGGRPNPFAPSFSNSNATSTMRGPNFETTPPPSSGNGAGLIR